MLFGNSGWVSAIFLARQRAGLHRSSQLTCSKESDGCAANMLTWQRACFDSLQEIKLVEHKFKSVLQSNRQAKIQKP
jgi:hypothetical protein